MRYITLIVLIILAAMIMAAQSVGAAPALRQVYVIRIAGEIDSTNQRYLERTLRDATERQAQLFLIEMDTPGGLGSAMDAMTHDLLASQIPTAVYVSPAGAGAGSAGVFIAMAADVVGMAPGTRIGSAHPVTASGDNIQSDMRDKVTNYYAAYIRSLAATKHHNADWAERAVRDSVSLTDQEALQQGVINVVARDRDDLLRQINGMQVTTATGPLTIDLNGAPVVTEPLSWSEQIVRIIINPDIAFLLLLIGIIALIAEFTHPGAIVPGIVGTLFLILFLVASESLPLNWGGVALIGLAVVLIALETQIPSHGALGLGALAAFVLGSLILYSPFTPLQPETIWYAPVEVNRWLIAASAAVMSGIILVAIKIALEVRHKQPVTGVETLVGVEGVATSTIPANGIGTVKVRGESWTAISSGQMIHEGEHVIVQGFDGLKMRVRRVETTEFAGSAA